MAANQIGPKDILRIGQRLSVPVAPPSIMGGATPDAPARACRIWRSSNATGRNKPVPYGAANSIALIDASPRRVRTKASISLVGHQLIKRTVQERVAVGLAQSQP